VSSYSQPVRALTPVPALVVAVAVTAMAHPAGAMSVDRPPASVRAGGTCDSRVLGFDSDHHLRVDFLVADRVVRTLRTSNRLSADVTALGFYDRRGQGRNANTRLNVVSGDGVPRTVTLDTKGRSARATKIAKYDQASFAPRLFAQGYTFYAYTVSGSTMRRWTLVRYRDGKVRFVPTGVVGNGFHDVTALQASVFAKVHGEPSELLYATTRSGELWQILVPLNRPGRARVIRLAGSGYKGTTELSWSDCDPHGTGELHSLVAIDPAANRATWTTVRSPLSRPRAVLRGEVTGEADWRLSAAL
jgi:hypothetical protein